MVLAPGGLIFFSGQARGPVRVMETSSSDGQANSDETPDRPAETA